MIDVRELTIQPGTSSATGPTYTTGGRAGGSWEQLYSLPESEGSGAPIFFDAERPSDATSFVASAQETAATAVTETILVSGSLPGGYHLRFPLPVELRREGSELVAAYSALRLHTFGADINDAIESFRESLVEQLQLLEGHEDSLSPALQDDLGLLRALVRPPA